MVEVLTQGIYIYVAAGFVQPETFGKERTGVQGDASP